jgi:hypothetical protein
MSLKFLNIDTYLTERHAMRTVSYGTRRPGACHAPMKLIFYRCTSKAAALA